MENLTLRLKNRRSYAFGGLPLYSEVLFEVMIETMSHRSFFYSLGNALNRRITTAFLLGQQGNKEPGKEPTQLSLLPRRLYFFLQFLLEGKK